MSRGNCFIDIRRSDEVMTKRFDGSKMNNFYNIPANHIRFNREIILNHLEYFDRIYLVCASGNRSQMIKDKYFSNDNRIMVNKDISFNNFPNIKGEHIIELGNNKVDKVWITGTFSFNLYNMTRIIQIIVGMVMLVCSVVLLRITQVPIVIKVVLLGMGTVALYSGITSSCFMARMLKDVLN
jgi:hypothetical protein